MVVIVWKLNLQLSMQSVPITTKVVILNPIQAGCTRYVIKLVSDLWFSLVSSTNKTDCHEILLKVALNTTTLTPNTVYFMSNIQLHFINFVLFWFYCGIVLINQISGKMVSVLALSAVDCVFDPIRSNQRLQNSFCCFSVKHAALRRKSKDG